MTTKLKVESVYIQIAQRTESRYFTYNGATGLKEANGMNLIHVGSTKPAITYKYTLLMSDIKVLINYTKEVSIQPGHMFGMAAQRML